MGDIKIKLSDEVEMFFRKNAMEAFGYSRGSLSSAAEQAIKHWVASRPKTNELSEPVSSIRGMLKHVRKSAVELQHELGSLREARHAHRR
ncbi:MAG: hypothetical protein AABX60_00180 [Nanoarchaeota archaeon]